MNSKSGILKIVIAALAIVCLVLIAWFVIGALTGGTETSFDDSPTDVLMNDDGFDEETPVSFADDGLEDAVPEPEEAAPEPE